MLLIDSGNSRIKWAQEEGGEFIQQGVSKHPDWEGLQQVFSNLPQPHKIIVSNVAGDNAELRIREACALWPCPIIFVKATDEQCGVRNRYEQPAQLGSDRWAALIAAWHDERKACLVVNCGTATTIDMLSVQGEFIGGVILPGVEMMLHSLTKGTAGLRQVAGTWRKFPLNTADAVFSGAIQATVGAIQNQHDILDVQDAQCILSGGAVDLVQPHLNLPFKRVENLVLRGLQRIGWEAGA